jgi:methyl-accepting chemotaxis protein
MADLSVRVKILGAIGIAVLVALAVGIVGQLALRTASDRAQLIYSSNVASMSAIGHLRASAAQARVDLANHLISSDEAGKTKYGRGFAADLETFEAAMAAYHKSVPAGPPAVIDDLQAAWDSYVQIAQTKQLVNGAKRDFAAWTSVRDTEINPLFVKITQDLDALFKAEDVDAAKSAAAARSGYRSSRIEAIAVIAIGIVLALGVGWLVARNIVRSLARVQHVCDGLADGDLTRLVGLTSRDEPGRMGSALDAAMQRLRGTVSTIDQSATSLAGASEEMNGVAAQIASSAEETSAQARAVAAAAEQVSHSVGTVSAGSEEMGASIREIAQNAAEAARVAGDAVAVTSTTSATMSQLGESSAEIGNVVKVITSIAEQTNLLALNATIEAARAGEAGKGFAVVASEVKDLAQETARATEDIARRVQAIQADTAGAVAAIEQVSQVIARISDYQTTIASAVEQQTATTAEMSRSVSEAAVGTGDISGTIGGVADAARLTSEGVGQSQQATAELARMSTELSSLVASFRY